MPFGAWLERIRRQEEEKRKRYRELGSSYFNTQDPAQRQANVQERIDLWKQLHPETAKGSNESEMARLEREKERLIGAELGRERFGTTDYAAEHMDQLARLREQMNLGFRAPELEAARSSRLADLARNEAMQNRMMQAQLARSGIRGGASANIMRGMLQQQQQQRAEAARSMFQEDIAKKEAARQEYAKYLGRLHLGQLASEAGEQMMGVSERTSSKQLEAAKEAAAAARSATGGKK